MFFFVLGGGGDCMQLDCFLTNSDCGLENIWILFVMIETYLKVTN